MLSQLASFESLKSRACFVSDMLWDKMAAASERDGTNGVGRIGCGCERASKTLTEMEKLSAPQARTSEVYAYIAEFEGGEENL